MDRDRFDDLTRLLATGRSRRRLIGVLTSVGLGGLLGHMDDESTEAKRKRHGRRRSHRPGKRKDNRKGKRKGGNGGNGLGNDCTVCASGCSFTSIQAAIDDAETNKFEQIVVCPGTYKERITFGAGLVPTLTVIGSGPEETIIDAGGAGSAVTVNGGPVVELQRFTITGGKADIGGGIDNRGSLTLHDCQVTGNIAQSAAGGGGGIYNNGVHLILELVTVSDNQAVGGKGGGILNAGGTLGLQDITIVTANTASQGGGIFNEAGATVAVDSSSSVSENEPDNCVGTDACPV